MDIIERHEWYLQPKWLEDISKVNLIKAKYYNDELLKQIKSFVNLPTTLTCNGTSALYLGMLSLGLKENDEIIIPSFSYPAVDRLAKYMKLQIKYCDIKKDTFCMDPEYLKTIISSNTKAVCFINHLGYVGEDILYIRDICKSYNVLFFEDSAQGLGQYYQNQMAGTFGEFGIISFSGAKTISSGEGGLIFSKNKSLIENVQKLQNVENNEGIGNYTMSSLTSYIITQQLKDWNWIIENKLRIYDTYSKYLKISYPFISDKNIGYNSLVYISDNAYNISIELRKKNQIKTRYKFYPIQEVLPNTIKIFDTYIELPQNFSLTDSQIKNICKLIKIIEMRKG